MTFNMSLPGPAGSLNDTVAVVGTVEDAMFSLHSTVIVSPTSRSPLVGPPVPLRKATGTGPALSWGAVGPNDGWFPAASWIALGFVSATVKTSTAVFWTPDPSAIVRIARDPDVVTERSEPPEGTFARIQPAVHGETHVASVSLNCTVTWSTR